MWRNLWLSAALMALTGVSAEAADSQGRFAAHGLGRVPCKSFVEMCEKGADECKLTGTWVAGYLSAFNALNKDTFDILPWQQPELVAEGAFNLCRRNPDAALVQTVNEVVKILYPQRVAAATERVQIGEGKGAAYLYRDTVKDVQERLIATGHLKGKADGAFGPGSKAALEAFQKDAGLEVTGVPNMRTLMALFYGGQAPQQQGEAAPRQAPAAQPAQPASQPAPKLDLNLVPKSP
jgi:hypothetical protein